MPKEEKATFVGKELWTGWVFGNTSYLVVKVRQVDEWRVVMYQARRYQPEANLIVTKLSNHQSKS